MVRWDGVIWAVFVGGDHTVSAGVFVITPCGGESRGM